MQPLTTKFDEKSLAALRAIAKADKRSVGYFVREAVAFWLANSPAAKQKGSAK
jgi:Ribbon-helix-helix protein, copG family